MFPRPWKNRKDNGTEEIGLLTPTPGTSKHSHLDIISDRRQRKKFFSTTISVITTRALKYHYPRLMSALGNCVRSYCIYVKYIGTEFLFWRTINFTSVIGRICVCFMHSGAWLQYMYPGKTCLWCEDNVYHLYSLVEDHTHMHDWLIGWFGQHVVKPNRGGQLVHSTRLILALRPANERRRYNVTPSLIAWAQT